MALRDYLKSAVTKLDPVPWLSEKDRKRFYTAEDYYDEKYPKLNITFPRYELDVRNQTDFRKDSYKSYSRYNCDVRAILNSANFKLPRIAGENDDEIALNGLKWIKNNLNYVSDSQTSAWNLVQWNNERDQINKWLSNPEKVDVNDFLKVINARMHTIHDYWSYSYQTYQRGTGDCEDGTVLLYDILRKSGIPAWKLRVNAGHVNKPDGTKGGHVWLTYYVESQFWKGKSKREDKWVYLDWCNGGKYLNDLRTPLDERDKWSQEPLYDTNLMCSFNEDYCWSFGKHNLLGTLYHTEKCPAVSSKAKISNDMKKKIEEAGLSSDIFNSHFSNRDLCNCKND